MMVRFYIEADTIKDQHAYTDFNTFTIPSFVLSKLHKK